MGLQIILPSRAVAYRCACGQEFADKARGKRHSIKCADRHQDEIEEMAAERAEFTTPLDPEAWKWGRKRISEGKVGFKRGRAA